jgi:hypothetical protein
MKRKVKKFAEGGTNVRTRTDEEFAEDSKFGGYGKYMPKTKSYSMDEVKSGIGKLLGGKSSPSEDRPTSSGVEDYASMGKRSGAMPAKSTWDGSTDIRPEKPQDISEREPDSVAGEGAKNLAFEPDAETVVKKKTVIKKKPAVDNSLRLMKPKDPSRALEEARKHYTGYEDTGAKIGSQGDFKMKPAVPEKIEDKKRYGQGLTPYEKGKSISDMSKMLSGGKKETNKSIDDDEKLFSTRRRAAGMSQKINEGVYGMKKGGATKKMASGGKVSSASSRGDGIAQRGKTKGRIC